MKLGRVMVWGISRSLVSTLAGLALSFAAAGCGGDGGTCGVAACGGDVVGNWQARSACIDQATLNMEFLAGIMGSCPTASVGNVRLTPTGAIVFTADMMVTSTLSLSSTLDLNFPATCTSGASCADLTTALQTLVGSGGITSVNCTGSSGCTCTLAQTVGTVGETGTWATSGTTLTVTDAMGGEASPYCVQGSSLHLLEFDSGGMMKIVSDIILSKQ